MSYDDLLRNGEISNFLVKVSARNSLTRPVTVDGSYLYFLFELGDPQILTNATSSGGTSGEVAPESTDYARVSSLADVISETFYFDESTKRVYMLLSDYVSIRAITITYDLYYATENTYAPKNPDTYTGDQVHWEPLMMPGVTIPSSDIGADQGFIPNVSGSLKLNNSEHEFDKHIGASFFYNAPLKIYHTLSGEVEDNTQLVFSGFISNVSSNQPTVDITFFSSISLLDGSFSYGRSFSDNRTFQESDYPLADPAFIGRYMRLVYGYVRDLRMIGIEYDTAEKTQWQDTTNRYYAAVKHYGNLNSDDIEVSVTALVSSNTFVITNYHIIQVVIDVDDATGLQFTDTLFRDTAGSGRNMGWQVLSVSGNRLTINLKKNTARTEEQSFVVGEKLFRSRINNLRVYNRQKGESVQVHMDNAPTYNATTKMLEIQILTNKFTSSPFQESDLREIARPSVFFEDPGNLTFYASVYGQKDPANLDNAVFSTNTSKYGVTSRWYEVLYGYLINEVGMPEELIDTDNLLALKAGDSGKEVDIGMVIPETVSGEPDDHRSFISKLLSSVIGLAGIRRGGRLYFNRIKPTGTPSHVVTDEDIIENSFSVRPVTTDVANIVGIKANYSEIRSDGYGLDSRFVNTYFTSRVLQDLSGITKKQDFDSWVTSEFAVTSSFRRLYYNGVINYIVNLSVGLDYYDVLVGETITVERDNMYGFGEDEGRVSKDFIVLRVERDRDKVKLTLLDAVGVNDTNYRGNY